MKRQRVIRFEAPGAEVLDRLLGEPLPLGLEETDRHVDFSRVLYFDTPAGDLARRGAEVRLCIPREGRPQLIVTVRDRDAEAGWVDRQDAQAQVDDTRLPRIFELENEPARLVRALIDPARLTVSFELESMRRIRCAVHPDDPETGVEISYDSMTVRQDDLAGDLYEVEVRIPAEQASHFAGLVQAFESDGALQLTLGETVARARSMLEDLELSTLERAVRTARAVAVVAYSRGRLAFCRTGSRLTVPSGEGFGQETCRRVLRGVFGHAAARIRLLATSPGAGSRPAVEVWLAEGIDEARLPRSECLWMPVEQALAMVGSPELRESRTLTALHAVARAGLVESGVAGNGGAPDMLPASAEPLFRGIDEDEDDDDAIDETTPKEKRSELMLNRELSRLAFDERMLYIVEDPGVPLLERVRFLSMFGSRIDDFFATRVAEFKEQVANGVTKESPEGLTPIEQLELTRFRTHQILNRAYQTLGDLLGELEQHGIGVVSWDDIAKEEQDYLLRTYAGQAAAVITPVVTDPAHPFPRIRNLRPSIAAHVRLPESRVEHFVAIEFPGEMPRFIPLPGRKRFLPLEELILALLPQLYPGLEVTRAHAFRLTRSATSRLGADTHGDMLLAVEEEVSQRPFRPAVRLEVERDMPQEMRDHILRELQYESPESLSLLTDQDVFVVDWLVDLAALREIAAIEMPELKYDALSQNEPLAPDRSIFEQIAERDRLVCFPHDSFEATVERFLTEAADDPAVTGMKITLYRTAPDSAIVKALSRARRAGKDAFALVELKASFDERRNIKWARSLEAAGVHVVFSPARYKVHAKIAMVMRREAAGIRRYFYIGTGNMNAATAKAYTDLGLLSADPDLGEELSEVFNVLTGYSGRRQFKHLLVSPFNARKRILELIEREIEHAEAGRGGLIRIQLNGLSDRRVIHAMYRASQAGVKLDLAVREICRLRPGVNGVSENVRVVSLMGRLLQHMRIFHFGNAGDPEYFIGSADWRPRNLSWRVEVITPIYDVEHRKELDRMLTGTLTDPAVWELQPDGAYVRADEVVGGGEEPPVDVDALAEPGD